MLNHNHNIQSFRTQDKPVNLWIAAIFLTLMLGLSSLAIEFNLVGAHGIFTKDAESQAQEMAVETARYEGLAHLFVAEQ